MYIIIGQKQFVKVFSAKFSFCTETQKFSTSKIFLYTVLHVVVNALHWIWRCREGDEEYVSTQMLIIRHWAGPSVIAHLASDSTPDRAE